MPGKKSGHPVFGHFVSKLGVFGSLLPFSLERFICIGFYFIFRWIGTFSLEDVMSERVVVGGTTKCMI